MSTKLLNILHFHGRSCKPLVNLQTRLTTGTRFIFPAGEFAVVDCRYTGFSKMINFDDSGK